MSDEGRPPAADCNRLWALSGGVCASPGCEQSLVEQPAGKWITQGEVAHIHAHSPGGARYRADMTSAQRDSYENTLLLCRRHHRTVDSDEEAYPAELLSEWKRTHEARHVGPDVDVIVAGNLLLPPPYPELYLKRPALTNELLRQVREGPVALTGISGAGKTSLAVEVFDNETAVNLKFWLRGQDEYSLLSDLAAVGVILNVPPPNELDDRSVRAVRKALEARSDWLIVVDNVEDPRVLRHLPRGPGLLLVTTQLSEVPGLLAYPCELLTGTQSCQLLRSSPSLAPLTDNELLPMARLCDGLPILVAQVAAFAAATAMPVAAHLALLTERRGDLLSRGELAQHETFLASVELTLERLSTDTKDLLAILAALADAPVPLINAVHSDNPLLGVVSDALRLEDAIAELRRYSLASRDSRSLRLHALVRDVVRQFNLAPRYALVALALIGTQVPELTHRADNWPLMEMLEPHLLLGVKSGQPAAAGLSWFFANKLGNYLSARGRVAEARVVFEAGLQSLPDDDPSCAGERGSLEQNLANVLADQGDLPAAEAGMRRALVAKEAAYGPMHVLTGLAHAGLGNVLHSQGRHKEARAEHEKAYEVYEALGDVVAMADALNDIAATMKSDPAGADELLVQAERLLAPDGGDWAITSQVLTTRAMVLADGGDLLGAFDLAVRSVRVARAAAEVSPELAKALGTQGMLLNKLGLPHYGVRLLRRAFETFEAVDNAVSVDAARVQGNMAAAGLLVDMPRCEAVQHLRDALATLESLLPEGHHTIVTAKQMLDGALAQRFRAR